MVRKHKKKSEIKLTFVIRITKSDESIPEFKQGEVLTVSNVTLTEGKTSPPDYLTESELIGLMEQNGIGTDASIPTHINNICQRNYVQVTSGRKLIPTNLGIVLIHGYQKIDPELSLPTMRSDVEQQLNLIASGKASHGQVLEYFLNMFAKKFAYFTKQVNKKIKYKCIYVYIYLFFLLD